MKYSGYWYVIMLICTYTVPGYHCTELCMKVALHKSLTKSLACQIMNEFTIAEFA